MNPPAPLPSPACPALLAAASERAQRRFLEFFAAAIRNPHTRRAYVRAVGEFFDWCARIGITALVDIEPLHVATWIESQTRQVAAPTVKQQLAAIRHLFDWLVTGQVVLTPPSESGRPGARAVP